MNHEFEIKNGVLVKYHGSGGAVIIPDNVTSIGRSAFKGCTSLTSVTLLDSVTIIGEMAFEECTNLTSVTIPDSVTIIGRSAFEKCTSLTSITIPDSVTRIGDSAFSDTPWLENYPDDFVIINKILVKYKGNDKAVTIPDSVTSIGRNAFWGCVNMNSVTIPDTVVNIEYETFFYTGEISIRICDALFKIEDMEEKFYQHYSYYLGPVEDYDKSYLIHSVFCLTACGEFDFYSERLPENLRCELLCSIFKRNPASSKFLEIMKENLLSMFAYLVAESEEENKPAFVQRILNTGFITKENIDRYTELAIENKAYEIQVMLMEYKTKHNWYDDDETTIKKKFSL